MSRRNNTSIINLKELGWTEMYVAIMPILSPYYLGALPILFWMSLLMIVVSIYKNKKPNLNVMKPLLIFCVYWLFHELILSVVANDINFNKRIANTVALLFIFFIVPMLDLKKLIYSLNFVSLICIVGLLFQLTTIMRGGTVHPLEIPGLLMSTERLEAESVRPSSFFMEPAAYAIYMYAPLTLSLITKKYWWSAILVVAMFLTTSTTALFAAFIILGVFVLTQGLLQWRSFFVIIFSFVLLYGLNNLSIFEVGVNKLENTEFETSARIAQGPIVVGTMHLGEMIFGVPYGDSGDYFKAGRTIGNEIHLLNDSIYMSTIWWLIFSLGIVGLILYLNVFYRLAKRCRELWPMIFCLFITMFTASINIGYTFIYSVIVLYVIAVQYKPLEESNKLTIK